MKRGVVNILKYIAIYVGFGYIAFQISWRFLDSAYLMDNWNQVKLICDVIALIVTFICIRVEDGDLLVSKPKTRKAKIVKWLLIIATLGFVFLVIRRVRRRAW
jgi:hypothetical protein